MPRLYRWITAMLAVCILINMIPVTAFAQDLPVDAALVEDQSPETVEPETTLTTETESQETESQKTESQETESQETESQETESQETESQETESQETESQETESQETEPQETESQETQPEETELEEDYAISLLVLTDPFAVQFKNELNNSDLKGKGTVSENGGRITLTVTDGRVLGLLAQQSPYVENNIEYYYDSWIIELSASGQINLPADFVGLGTETHPFKGGFQGTDRIVTQNTMFNWLSTKADLGDTKIEWIGTADQPILTKVLVADANGSVNMPLNSSTAFSPYIGRLQGNGKATLPSLNYTNATPSTEVSGSQKPVYPSDVGILCGSMAAGSQLEIDADNLTLPAFTLKANGHVGSLVGSMGGGAKLTITGTKNLNLTANLTGTHVGGFVGYAQKTALDSSNPTVLLNAPVTVSGTLNSTGSAGAIAGVVDDGPLLDDTSTGTVTVGAVNITASDAEDYGAGVLYGQYTTSEDYDLAHIAFASGTRQVSGYNCGGIFGKLTLTQNAKCTISGSTITTTLNSATNYGGIVGKLEGERENALTVKEKSIVTTYASDDSAAQYLGGLVGIQNATLDAQSSTVLVNKPRATTSFGGLSAQVGDGELLLADTMSVSTGGTYCPSTYGGGVAGTTGVGSIVYLKNSLDISGCALTTKAGSGQLVGFQDCSLVYAPDVTISRLKTGSYNGMNLDDIGNYGQPYYIKGFLTQVENSYEIRFPIPLQQTSEGYVLKNETDYALLALAWQSRGAFATVSGITNINWEELQSSTIKLNADINLSGCGIGGLSRDVSTDKFTGKFYGGGHTLTLDIGHENNGNGISAEKGDGRICSHNAVGLFAELSGSAYVENLTLAGTIRISNLTFSDTGWGTIDKTMHCGALAAKLSTTGKNPISNVSTKVSVDDARCNTNIKLYLGGLFGLVTSSVPSLNIDSEQGASITAYCTNNGSSAHIGGVIGAIEGGSGISITCSRNAKLSGSIECKNSVANNYAGGLIGTILPGGTPTVNLTKLEVDGFTFTGNAATSEGITTARMGGILGCIWADTTVKIDDLTVKGATLKATGADVELGGLVYRASGKWTVSKVDLSGLTVNAPSAKALGLMVCKGGTFKEPLNNATDPVRMGGLYLVMSTPWATGYIVPEADTAISCGSAIFDEFVAYTAYADPDKSEPNYQITANGSGIISLTANKNGDGHLITYENRTKVSQKTNLYSRYYYNLPEVLGECTGDAVDTPQKLLIWSVYHYAASNLQSEFIAYSNTISGNLNMKGLSYYPISITNGGVTVQNATITFWNSEIEALVTDMSTRGTSTEHSQHYTMHCGLFLNFTADVLKPSSLVNLTMTVNNVSFAGTVGVVNGKSGALVCGTVAGDSVGAKTSVCKVILASSDDESFAVKLDGISVEPSAAGTRPVLIGSMDDYVVLEANYLDYTDKQFEKEAAGTSLIGNVGGTGAASVTVDLKGTIKLPDKKTDGVFTGATLFNSLQFKNGSAKYVFLKKKEHIENTYEHNATYGKELSYGVSVEYRGKEGCYNDGFGSGHYISGDEKQFNTHMNFDGYLPYVRYSPATSPDEHGLASGYHELAVNVLFMDVTAGCGTYGDPYRITANDAGMLNDIAQFINTGKAPNNWEVTIPGQQGYHSQAGSGGDITLRFSGTKWMIGEAEYTGNVQKHLASAYYCFEEDISLPGFYGFGSDTPDGLHFTGVITGKDLGNKTYPKVTLSGSNGLINYSYGSVVRDLNVELTQKVGLNRGKWERGNAEKAPKTFYGGVIGCVLGGDNIIENVNVTTDTFSVELGGTNPHLIPVGGYVGVIAGGGVIFRGSCTGGIPAGTTLYHNSVIGRVLDGFAFYESDRDGNGTAPTNTGTDYKINKLDIRNTSCLSWKDATQTENGTLTIGNEQGLLILSGIVSSGAGNKNSVAYASGKARLASYEGIGTGTAENPPDDYAQAVLDDNLCWTGNQVPYLLSQYVSGGNPELCPSNNPINITLGDGIVMKNTDKSDYGNGYRGLSARYVSNAAFTSSGVDADLVVMRVGSFNGNAKTVSNINMDVKEYEDDDFHAASLGGIFNIVWAKAGGGTFAQNLTLDNCTVKLQYVRADGTTVVPTATLATLDQEDGRSGVAVGGFIGSISSLTQPGMGATTANYLFNRIRIQNSEITGPNSAGGLIGATAMTSTALKDRYPGHLLSNGISAQFGPSFLNCSYSQTTVTGNLAAGGLVGFAFAGTDTIQFASFGGSGGTSEDKGCYATCTVTDSNVIVGANSSIVTRAHGGVSAGLFGAVGMRILVNFYGSQTDDLFKRTGLWDLKDIDRQTMQSVCLEGVTVRCDIDYGKFVATGTTNNGLENGKYLAAAGCVARIGGANRAYFNDIQLNNCTIQAAKENNGSVKLNATTYAAGVLSYGYTNTNDNIDRCSIIGTTMTAQNVGGFVGFIKSSGATLNLSNSKLEDCTLTGSATTGGVMARVGYNQNLYNILLKNNQISGGSAGRLYGNKFENYTISAAGISIFSNTENQIPIRDVGDTDSYPGYVAYADYAGTETLVDSYEAPYVVANPNHALDGTKLLTGDAVGIRENAGTIGALIWKENQTNATRTVNHAPYGEIRTTANRYTVVDHTNNDTDSTDGSKTKLEISTFAAVQGCGPDTLPVLMLKDGNTEVITDYLDVITNGGYSLAGNAVSLSDTVYYWEKDTFVEATQDRLKGEPKSIFRTGKNLSVNVNSYDNQRNRFTLIEAVFTTEINGTKQTYTVSIPVVVVRELQFVYNATLSYGKEFKTEEYPKLTNHLLESTGTPFSAYITYQYNRTYDGTSTLAYAEYDWQGYMDGKGNMLGVDKKLIFTSGALPEETELILLDCQNGNRAYSYVVPEDSSEPLLLSSFHALDDGTPFRSSMAEILGVERTPVDNGKGKYVEVSGADITSATVRLKNDDGSFAYYRLVEDEETGTHNLTVPNLDERIPTENYLLVVNIPNQGDNFSINGKLQSELVWVNPSSGTKLLRDNDNTKDGESNTVSTYQISSGYQQNLKLLETPEEAIDLMKPANQMKVQIKDTITFDNKQIYNLADDLFLKISVGLLEMLGTDSKDVLFPQGTTGTVKFYVQAGGKYFYYENGTWSSDTPEKEAVSYEWTWNPERGSMRDLLLSADGETPLSLAQVREEVKSDFNEIIVTAQMDIVMDETLLRAVVPTSEKQGVDNYVYLQYCSQLSTTQQGLDYSTARDYAPDENEDKQRYYLGVSSEAVLSMDATNISQLGVNPLAPIPEYLTGDGKSKIDCVISLDLENLQNLDALLERIDSVSFQLALYKRNGAGYTAKVDDSVRENYISFQWPDDSEKWVWTIKPTVGEYFNGKQFNIPLTANVSMDVADYANYKVGVTVTFNGKGEQEENVKVSADNAYIVYTYACIRPNFYAGS